MGTLNSDLVDALNMLLEDERASVEIEAALSNGATEYRERDALTTMGVEDSLISFQLRDWLESRELPVTRRINGIVLQALDLTRYDDRLTLFAQHQLASREQAEQLLTEDELDTSGQEILREIVDAHARHAVWSEQRAQEFAETRQFEFRRPLARQPETGTGDAGTDVPPDTSGEHSSPRQSTSAHPDSGIEGAAHQAEVEVEPESEWPRAE
ncbi:MAG TPA: hypothetical protein VFN11_18380 [Ktedonobacterales bacterium]|nr:hypothetical protein [Ktedonobacterales bacterium]